MRKSGMHGQRGQAYTEFVVSLSFMLGSLFFAMSVARFAALNERAQTAVRYSSLIERNQDPYTYASLSSAYQSLKNEMQPDSSCKHTDVAILSGQGPFVGDTSAQFWLPDNTATANCTHPQKTLTKVSMSGFDLLLEQFDYDIQADTSGYMTFSGNFTGKGTRSESGSKQVVTAHATTFRAPSMTVLLHCYRSLGSIVNNSLYPPAADVQHGDDPVAPLENGDVQSSRQSLPVTPQSCQQLSANVGPQTIPSTPLPSEAPIQPDPTPPPDPQTPSPMQTPVISTPAPDPTSAPTPEPAATTDGSGTGSGDAGGGGTDGNGGSDGTGDQPGGTPGTGGGSGGGDGTGNGSDTGSGSGGGSPDPTAAPETPAPPTPAPDPATPAPSPTDSPTATPSPRPIETSKGGVTFGL